MKKILIVSIQKSGTHLIEEMFKSLGYKAVRVGENFNVEKFKKCKKKEYFFSHFIPNDQVLLELYSNPNEYGIIYNFRDPRDTLTSKVNWNHSSNDKITHPMREFMKDVYSRFSKKELLDRFIDSDKIRPNEYDIMEYFSLGRILLFSSSILNVRFEDLIGEKGGGSFEMQKIVVKNILQYIGLSYKEDEMLKVCGKLYNPNATTFTKGSLKSYLTFFSEEQIQRFNAKHNKILIDYGYF